MKIVVKQRLANVSAIARQLGVSRTHLRACVFGERKISARLLARAKELKIRIPKIKKEN